MIMVMVMVKAMVIVLVLVMVIVIVTIIVTVMVPLKTFKVFKLKKRCFCYAAQFYLLLNKLVTTCIKLVLNHNDHQVDLLCQRGRKSAASKVGF